MSGHKTLTFKATIKVHCEWEDGRPDADSLRELMGEELHDRVVAALDGDQIDVEVLSAREDADDVEICGIIDVMSVP